MFLGRQYSPEIGHSSWRQARRHHGDAEQDCGRGSTKNLRDRHPWHPVPGGRRPGQCHEALPVPHGSGTNRGRTGDRRLPPVLPEPSPVVWLRGPVPDWRAQRPDHAGAGPDRKTWPDGAGDAGGAHAGPAGCGQGFPGCIPFRAVVSEPVFGLGVSGWMIWLHCIVLWYGDL